MYTGDSRSWLNHCSLEYLDTLRQAAQTIQKDRSLTSAQRMFGLEIEDLVQDRLEPNSGNPTAHMPSQSKNASDDMDGNIDSDLGISTMFDGEAPGHRTQDPDSEIDSMIIAAIDPVNSYVPDRFVDHSAQQIHARRTQALAELREATTALQTTGAGPNTKWVPIPDAGQLLSELYTLEAQLEGEPDAADSLEAVQAVIQGLLVGLEQGRNRSA
jgi:hypothetical protein